jgi:hypothetical protein
MWLLGGALVLGLGGCGTLREVRDEIVGVKPAVERCLGNTDHVTPAWLPIPHLACRGGTPRVPAATPTDGRGWVTRWLEES